MAKNHLLHCRSIVLKMTGRPSSAMAAFRGDLHKAKHVIVLSGAGISAESGIPTFRGSGGLWRRYKSTRLATPEAFEKNPALVWEFYHHRRETCLSKEPNDAHKAIADCQKRLRSKGRELVVITQNIDDLHQRAGTDADRCSKFAVQSADKFGTIGTAQFVRPYKITVSDIDRQDLPRCPSCSSLTRPHVVWFGESLDSQLLDTVEHHLDRCDLCLVVGTSSVVYPAAVFAPQLANRGVPVAEFNLEDTPKTLKFRSRYRFIGPATQTMPNALKPT